MVGLKFSPFTVTLNPLVEGHSDRSKRGSNLTCFLWRVLCRTVLYKAFCLEFSELSARGLNRLHFPSLVQRNNSILRKKGFCGRRRRSFRCKILCICFLGFGMFRLRSGVPHAVLGLAEALDLLRVVFEEGVEFFQCWVFAFGV